MKTHALILALAVACAIHIPPVRGQYISGSGAAPVLLASRDDSGRIFLWDETGGLRTGWPVAASGAWPAGTPRLQDLDGDGQPEVVCLMKSSNGGKSVRAWRLDGQPCPGHESCAAPASMAETPLLGSVEAAGSPSWVWPTSQGAISVSPPGDPTHPRPGFPFAMSGGRLRLRLADLDGDGVMEVLGGEEDGATGQWFILRDKGGHPTLYFVDEPAPVTAAPAAAQLLSDAPYELLVAMADRMECQVSDGHGGYSAAAGWPVATPAIHGGDLALVARPAFRFETYAGTDSAGRFRLVTQELGDRHHGVHVSAPAGLLPINECRIWLNGNLTPRTGPPPVVAPGETVVRGGWIDAEPASRPELVLALTRDNRPVATARGPVAAELRLMLDPGTYRVLVSSAADTMTRLEFDVQAELTLGEVYGFPNPMRQQMEFLFTLSGGGRHDGNLHRIGPEAAHAAGEFRAGSPERGVGRAGRLRPARGQRRLSLPALRRGGRGPRGSDRQTHPVELRRAGCGGTAAADGSRSAFWWACGSGGPARRARRMAPTSGPRGASI